MAVYQFYKEQKLNTTVEEIWRFISSPRNLKEITPDYMGFEITTDHLSDIMYPGMIISYKVSPVLGLKMTWVTEITHVEEHDFFVDEQRKGPYKMWHHEHKLIETEDGVIMTDLITYEPPFGFLGAIANKLFIKKQLGEIFDYRTKVLDEKFNKPSRNTVKENRKSA
ncbi:MAG: SRPBCC family protein [Flavobacteriales bacterium]